METLFIDLAGKTITQISGAETGSDEIYFKCSDGTEYKMFHSQDCCESVQIEDIIGDPEDILNSKILRADESSSYNEDPEGYQRDSSDESFTWTFYNLATKKGHVTIRWYGSSNGYYSESVDFIKL